MPTPNGLDETSLWIVADGLESQLVGNFGRGISVVPETSSCAGGFIYRIDLPAGKGIRFRDVWNMLPKQTLPGCRRQSMPYKLRKVPGDSPGETTVEEQLELFELTPADS